MLTKVPHGVKVAYMHVVVDGVCTNEVVTKLIKIKWRPHKSWDVLQRCVAQGRSNRGDQREASIDAECSGAERGWWCNMVNHLWSLTRCLSDRLSMFAKYRKCALEERRYGRWCLIACRLFIFMQNEIWLDLILLVIYRRNPSVPIVCSCILVGKLSNKNGGRRPDLKMLVGKGELCWEKKRVDKTEKSQGTQHLKKIARMVG